MIAIPTVPDPDHWRFPQCPEPPDWHLDWPALLQRFAWLGELATSRQDPIYHAEGNVLAHTQMVCQALVELPAWRHLPPEARSVLFAAALLHDAGKPARTVVEADGRISSRGHARTGARIAHRILYTEDPFVTHPAPFAARQAIVALVRHHGLPVYLLDRADPRRDVLAASQVVNCQWLALLAEADARGRVCPDIADFPDRVALFSAFAQEQRCLNTPYHFVDGLSRFVYFSKQHGDPDYAAYDRSRCEVVLLSGLPGSGKDTYARDHLAHWPMISLDALRTALDAPPSGAQGAVIAEARERARAYLRTEAGFVWNATNISRRLRAGLIDLFVAYGARVRLVYLEAPYRILQQRNQTRNQALPAKALLRLACALEVPDPTEAHDLRIIA
jgi:putative nucleotidyltransferase with HDIG domain